MTRKRRATAAPATPKRSAAALALAPAVAPTAGGGARSALSPPLKKRVAARRAALSSKVALGEDDDEEEAEEGEQQEDRADEEQALRLRHMRPDPYLPGDFRRRARVLRRGLTLYDAVLTRARVHHNQSEFVALQALELDGRFYLWTRAGRVGCAGKTALLGPLETETKAVTEFCASFASHTQCEWDERRHLHHARPYQDGCYTWIELDYSTGTPYSETLTSALTDNQGRLERVEGSLDEYGLLLPSLPFALSSTSSSSSPAAAPSTTLSPPTTTSGRKRRRSGTSTSTTKSSITTRRSLTAQLASCDEDAKTAAIGLTELEDPHPFPLPSALPETLQSFVTMIGDHHPPDMAYYYAYNLPSATDELGASPDISTTDDGVLHLPLGRLSKTTMQRGYETLEEIYEALRTRCASRAVLLTLSSHFYALVPHHRTRLVIIDTMVKLGKKVALMEGILRAHGVHFYRRIAREVEAVQRCRLRNYVDECYALMDCTLRPVSPETPVYSLIQTYIKNSNCCGRKQDRLQLVSVFSVEKIDQQRRYEPFRVKTNRRMLWHGSHVANWLGILSEGLRIAPPEVASNGRTFGKGLYFTDKVSKAQAYCHCRPVASSATSNPCIFLLSEVALGECKELINSDDNAKQFVHVSAGGRNREEGYDSCKGVGSCCPDPRGDVMDDEGTVWPLGKPVQPAERTGLHHSEYIIYNANQTRMRYVVLAKSNGFC